MLSLDQQNRLRDRYRALNPRWRPATEVYAETVRRHLQDDAVLLDLGCGRGGLIEQLDHPLSQVIGVDPDLISLGEHRLGSKRPTLSRVNTLSHLLPFDYNCFDIVMASWVLEHLSEPEADLKEIGRVLVPGGVFIFITPNKRHPLALINRLLSSRSVIQRPVVERIYDRSPEDTFPTYYRANDVEELERIASAAQLTITEVSAIEDPTYLALTPRLFSLALQIDKRLPSSSAVHLVGCMKLDN